MVQPNKTGTLVGLGIASIVFTFALLAINDASMSSFMVNRANRKMKSKLSFWAYYNCIDILEENIDLHSYFFNQTSKITNLMYTSRSFGAFSCITVFTSGIMVLLHLLLSKGLFISIIASYSSIVFQLIFLLTTTVLMRKQFFIELLLNDWNWAYIAAWIVLAIQVAIAFGLTIYSKSPTMFGSLQEKIPIILMVVLLFICLPFTCVSVTGSQLSKGIGLKSARVNIWKYGYCFCISSTELNIDFKAIQASGIIFIFGFAFMLFGIITLTIHLLSKRSLQNVGGLFFCASTILIIASMTTWTNNVNKDLIESKNEWKNDWGFILGWFCVPAMLISAFVTFTKFDRNYSQFSNTI